MKQMDLYRGINPLTGSEGMLAKTRSGGLPKREGTVCGTGDVKMCLIDGTTIREVGEPFKVVNPFGSDVQGDTYITIKRVQGHWIVDAEDCPA